MAKMSGTVKDQGRKHTVKHPDENRTATVRGQRDQQGTKQSELQRSQLFEDTGFRV